MVKILERVKRKRKKQKHISKRFHKWKKIENIKEEALKTTVKKKEQTLKTKYNTGRK
jgi:hypothetical protein